MVAAIVLAATLNFPAHVGLFRGAPIVTPKYWDVQDTYLDAGEPSKNFGGSYALLGGKGKTILIRFGDLNRVVGPRRHITRATLFLTAAGSATVTLHSVGRVLESWGEGPRTVLNTLFAAPPKQGVKPPPSHWQADYRQRKAGIASWHTAGATGAEDQEPITTAHIDNGDRELSITGLEQATQFMLDHPDRNFGYDLQFDSPCEFNSSKSMTGRPRLEIESEPAAAAPVAAADLSVTMIATEPEDPKPGQSVTYTATVKNVGAAEAKGFTGQWEADEKSSEVIDQKDPLAPGASTKFTLQRRFESSSSDHRTNSTSFSIEPSGPDACPANNSLTILEGAKPLTVAIPPELMTALNAENYLGSTSWEDWVQSQVALWNQTVASQSRFSFAPEGALERVRVQALSVGASNTALAVPADSRPEAANTQFLKSVGLALGLPNGQSFEIAASKVHVEGSLTRSNVDLNPGIMGYGDTRFDGGVPGPIPLPYVPAYTAALIGSYLEPTDLLCANDVAALNSHLATPIKSPSECLLPLSKAVIIRAVDFQGTPLANADLLFFQSKGGSIPSADPVFAVKTNEHGIAIVNSRGPGGPFGEFTPSGDNGVFLIQAKLNGVLETGWLSAWQLSEENLRGAITVSLYLNLPDSLLDRTANLALDRTLSDSIETPPSKMAALIDDDESTSVELPDTVGSWVEIDLGRDRFVGEVDLVSQGKPFWQQFDIAVYGTGQRVTEGSLFARELNWAWSSTVRRDAGKGSTTWSVAYRGYPQRIRYVRLTNKSGGAGSLNELKVFGAKLGQ